MAGQALSAEQQDKRYRQNGSTGRTAERQHRQNSKTAAQAEQHHSMKTIAFVNQKGGVGKTSLAASISVAAAESGETVVALDLDRITLGNAERLECAARHARDAAAAFFLAGGSSCMS